MIYKSEFVEVRAKMKKNHYRALCAVFPIILKTENEGKYILLHKRANTGYRDNMWDVAGSGHVDEHETAIQALVREGKEELGIHIELADVQFAHLSHNVDSCGDETYYNIYFFVTAFDGTPIIMEPEKCSDLSWFDVNSLPEDMIPVRRADVLHAIHSAPYTEYIDERECKI